MDHLTIGENTVVGSDSPVTKDQTDNVLAYGTPTKTIHKHTLGENFL